MNRAVATNRLEELLQRVTAGGDRYLDAVAEVSVFGSYAAGAAAPNDVDLDVEYVDPSGEIAREQLARMFAGKRETTPFEQALRGRHRGMNIMFNLRETLERQGGFTFVTLWTRGEPFERALERLHAIRVDPNAGSAPRDHVHPAIEGYEKRTPIDARERLIELDSTDAIRLRRLIVDRELEPRDPRLSREAGYGYSETSRRRSAMRTLVAQLALENVPIERSDRNLILTWDVPDRPFATVQHGAERLGSALDDALYHPARRSYCVLNLTGREPYDILEIEPS